MMLVQIAIVLQSYYWPIYFQSVKNASARDSGIGLLPTIVSNSIGTICAGWIASKSGHYVPLMWIGGPILASGGGLYQLIRADSPIGYWIGFQILSGLGYGLCSQMPILAVQVVLDKADIPTGLVVVMLFQMLGGALAPSIGQNLFTDTLLRELSQVKGINGPAVVAAGAKDFRKLVPPELLDAAIQAFVVAIRNVFWVAVAAPLLAWITSCAIEWRKLPDSKKAPSLEPVTEKREG